MIRTEGRLLTRARAFGADDHVVTSGMPELRAVDQATPRLPIVLQVREGAPQPGETWPSFQQRMADALGSTADRLMVSAGIPQPRPLFAAGALATTLTSDELDAVAADPGAIIDYADLDPLLPVVSAQDSHLDIGLAAFLAASAQSAGLTGGLTGAGVKVAVLDSGVDVHHPALGVAESASTCGEDVAIPGAHGTHCAGIIASTDTTVPGIAPGVTLVNIKALLANGSGRHTWVDAGIDEALNRGVNVLSLSLGFNQLPPTAAGGHGWSCADGRCPVCTAVDNAVALGILVVVATGNDHASAQQLRQAEPASGYVTELSCPGQASRALTVGAHHTTLRAPAWFSSTGPTAFGSEKPDICAPGVDIMSTIPVPRDAVGTPDLLAARQLMFGTKSGTSMATPLVAGACALLIEDARRAGRADNPKAISADLLARYCEPLTWPGNVVGAGRLRLS